MTNTNMTILFGAAFAVMDSFISLSVLRKLNAKRLVQFIVNWYAKFPEFSGNDMYLASESYGGHYLPITATNILEYSRRQIAAGKGGAPPGAEGGPLSQFRGFLVGNPYTNLVENNKGMMAAVWGHGLMPTTAYEEWKSFCGDGNVADDGDDGAYTGCSWLPWWYWDRFVGDADVNP